MLRFDIKPPYYAVIFTAQTSKDTEGYESMSEALRIEANKIPGFLGIESAGEGSEITVSYWKDLESIQQWKRNSSHQKAKLWGSNTGYLSHRTRICKVEKEY